MKHFAGLDVSLEETAICVVDGKRPPHPLTGSGGAGLLH